MEYELNNGMLSAIVSSRGGELRSLKKEGAQYLWQGDPAFWEERAPNLFPYIGRLGEESYFVGQKKYRMKIHGFLSGSELSLAEKTPLSLALFMEDTPDTRRQYPWRFRITLHFSLEGSALAIRFDVKNRDERQMYFGIGGHPGFRLPLEEGLCFEDYFLEFPRADSLCRIGFTEACLRSGEQWPFPLSDGRLALCHELFDQDAVVLKGTGGEVLLRSDKGKRQLRLLFPDMPYLGLWHRPFTEAPYLCIEPWASLPAREGRIEVLEQQPDLQCLSPGRQCSFAWKIELA